MKVFFDSGAFCALTIPKDTHNTNAKLIYKQLKELNVIIYTSDYVLDEVYTLLKSRGSHKTSVKFMEQIDKRLSFTDCASFALINHHGIESVFAFDKHFRYHHYSHPVKFWE